MSHTISRPRRFSRLAAGLTVAAATTATTLLGAAPAYAQANPITVSVSGGTLNVTGTSVGDIVTATGGSTVTLSALNGTFKILGGCTPLGATVRCNGVNAIAFSGLQGNDKFDNQTSRRSNLQGQEGQDILLGGSVNDVLSGGPGLGDVANGRAGNDVCAAETEISC